MHSDYPHGDTKAGRDGNRHTFFGFSVVIIGARDSYEGGPDRSAERIMRPALEVDLPASRF